MKKFSKFLLGTSILCLSFNLLSTFNFKTVLAETQVPKLQGTMALSMDMDTGEVIYSKNADKKSYPASITKLLTGLLLSENKQKTDELPYTKSALDQPSFSLYELLGKVNLGDTLSADELMKGLLLPSGNDTAYVISDAIGGNKENFAKLMNDKAKSLGMNESNFTNPNGLHEADHYSTAYDLALLGMAAYHNDWMKEIMPLKKDVKITTSTNQIAYVENKNKNVGINGCVGGKTGYTDEGGRCLLALYERDGRKIVGVVLNAPYDAQDTAVFNDMSTLIDYSVKADKKPVYTNNQTISTEHLNYKSFNVFGNEKTVDVPLVIREDVSQYENDINSQATTEINFVNKNPWSFKHNEPVATLTVHVKNSSNTYNLYTDVSSGTLFKANLLIYGLSVIAFLVLAIALFFIIGLARRANRRKRRGRYY